MIFFDEVNVLVINETYLNCGYMEELRVPQLLSHYRLQKNLSINDNHYHRTLFLMHSAL